MASWPGYGATHNPFAGIFLRGLEAAGCTVTSIDAIETLQGQGPDIVLLHWAERIFAEARSRRQVLAKITLLLRLLDRLPARTRIVWLVHNLRPHDARLLRRLVWPFYVRALSRRVDGFLTLSPGTVDPVRKALPGLAGKPGLGLWHPFYPDAALDRAGRLAARQARGWTAGELVLGYCGQIHPYKGVEDLAAAFLRTTRTDLRLVLAGTPSAPVLAERLRQMTAGDARIRLELADLPTGAFRAVLGACDVVAAPLRDYLHSGSILHALSAGRPVLTPDTAFAAALQGQLGPDWLRLYRGPLTPALLENAAAPAPATGPDLAAFAADAIGRQVTGFFRTLLAGDGVSVRRG